MEQNTKEEKKADKAAAWFHKKATLVSMEFGDLSLHGGSSHPSFRGLIRGLIGDLDWGLIRGFTYSFVQRKEWKEGRSRPVPEERRSRPFFSPPSLPPSLLFQETLYLGKAGKARYSYISFFSFPFLSTSSVTCRLPVLVSPHSLHSLLLCFLHDDDLSIDVFGDGCRSFFW